MKAEELASRDENMSLLHVLSGHIYAKENSYVVSNYKRRDGGDEEAHIKDFYHLINFMVSAINVVVVTISETNRCKHQNSKPIDI